MVQTYKVAILTLMALCIVLTVLLVLPDSHKPASLSGLSFQQFTGLSFSGISGLSGKQFEGNQCRSYSGKKAVQWTDIEKIYPKQLGDSGGSCKKWVVITSINEPTETMEHFDKKDDWCLVVVFDKKTPEDKYSSLSKSVLLTVEKQEEFMKKLNLQSLQMIPWNHFGRKNLGYMYAIVHGAEVIYDTDDDNVPIKDIKTDDPIIGVSTTMSAFNVYSKFKPANSSGEIWPRGFPLDLIKEEPATKCCSDKQNSLSVGVRQFLANHDPDVDAIYRLTSTLPYNFRQDVTAMAPAPGNGSFIPYNAQATLHFPDAYFGLILPITVHSRVTDIWRSYFMQKLLWLTGQRMAYMGPVVKQVRNVHSYLADFDSEVPLYIKSGELLKHLNSWTTSKVDVRDIMVDLAIDMYQHCYWEEDDVKLLMLWLEDLTRIGYAFPSKKSESVTNCAAVNC